MTLETDLQEARARIGELEKEIAARTKLNHEQDAENVQLSTALQAAQARVEKKT